MINKTIKTVGAVYAILFLLCIAFWGGVGYVAWHFISKYW